MEQPVATKKNKPKPIVAVVAVLIPLVALALVALVSQNASDDKSASATTLVQDGDPEAAGEPGKDPGKDDGKDGTTTTADQGDEGDGNDDPAAATDDIPSDPADAGPEGDRTTVTYPQPTIPSGGCSRPSGTVVITLGSTPDPPCLELAADQPVIIRNKTGKEISFVAISVNEVVAAGSEIRIGTAGSAFGDGQSTFWSPGNPQLSGIVVVG